VPYCYNQNWALQKIKKEPKKNNTSGFPEECNLVWMMKWPDNHSVQVLQLPIFFIDSKLDAKQS